MLTSMPLSVFIRTLRGGSNEEEKDDDDEEEEEEDDDDDKNALAEADRKLSNRDDSIRCCGFSAGDGETIAMLLSSPGISPSMEGRSA